MADHGRSAALDEREALPRPKNAAFQRLDAILAQGLAEARERFTGDPFRGLYVTAEDAEKAFEVLKRPQRIKPGWDEIIAAEPGWRWVRGTYKLTDLELDVLLIALASEADLRYERLYGYLQDDVTRRRPSVQLALELLAGTRGVFGVEAPLAQERLIALVAPAQQVAPPLPAHLVVLDDQIVDVLLGLGELDRALAASGVRLTAEAGPWTLVPLDTAERDALLASVRNREATRLYFRGPEGSGRRFTAGALAGELRVPALTADLRRLSEDPFRLFREAALHGALLYLDGVDTLTPELARAMAEHKGTVVLAGHQEWTPVAGEPLGVREVSFERRGFAVRRRIWESHGVPPELVDDLANRFRFGPGQVAEAVATATSFTRDGLFAAARAQTRHHLAGLATKVEPMAGWGELVLPGDSLTQLREMCERVTLGGRVWRDWGFDRRFPNAGATTALFAGPPGTGKTMAAEVIAGELGLDLFKIDLSAVISKYIGETEKNLDRVFAAAADADAILLFDEADALFGKRSEVRDAHDRYANIETAYLLQRMEQYDGIAILTTNLRRHLDDAFTRRLQFIVEFPFPDEAQRSEIWRVCLPAEVPTRELDFDRLGRDFQLAGGNIKNCVLHAAFLTAARETPLGMEQMLDAIRREYRKMGRILPETEGGAPCSTTSTPR
ncbi:ATP-binding protein [Amycolatopsis sp. NPDC059657]|uniref:ATP-binding protein n=1 Tax=Amycolatopsis sp. NPDC059657 TaxID=3346899 RepID=UPI00366BC4CE